MHSQKVYVEISGWKETQVAKKGLDLESRQKEKVKDKERLKELYVRGWVSDSVEEGKKGN